MNKVLFAALAVGLAVMTIDSAAQAQSTGPTYPPAATPGSSPSVSVPSPHVATPPGHAIGAPSPRAHSGLNSDPVAPGGAPGPDPRSSVGPGTRPTR